MTFSVPSPSSRPLLDFAGLSIEVIGTIAFGLRYLCQLADLILQIWAIVLSYSAATKVPGDIISAECINKDIHNKIVAAKSHLSRIPLVLRAFHDQLLMRMETTPTPNKNGSYGTNIGVRMP